MMGFRLLGTEFRVPVLLLAVAAGAGIAFGVDVISPALALLFHETGHILAAKAMRIKVTGAAVCPFGASMTIGEGSRSARAVTALGGPAMSLFCAALTLCAINAAPQLAFAKGFGSYSLVLCFFNLLPALPLDGGRILQNLLSEKYSQKIVDTIGLICGIIVCCVLFSMSFAFFPQINLPILAITAFTLYGCIAEYRMAKASAVTLMLQNELSLMHSGSIRLRTIGIHCRIRAREAAGCLRGAGLIAVMDDSSRLLGLLTEGDLLSGMVALGGEAQMTQILRFTRSENNLPVSLRSTS